MKKILLTIATILLFSTLHSQEYSFIYDGDLRSYLMHVPSNYDESKSYPVIISMHGLGLNGYLSKRWWDDIRSDIMEYIAVFPTGIYNGWNSYGDGYPDDVGYIHALIDTIRSNYTVDDSRIYLTGQSNGAHMSYTVAAIRPEGIAAIAPVEGYLFPDVVDYIHSSMPILHIHAMDDDVVIYEGNEEYGFFGVDSALSIWRNINNCSSIPDTLYNEDIILGLRWPSPNHTADVALIKYEYGGHMMLETPVNCTDFILDFFYSVPSQKLTLRLTDELKNTYTEHSDILINTVVEPVDSVAKMEFYANLTKIGEDTLPPFSIVWNDVPYGYYYISARATDSSGQVVVSSNPKQVNITMPNIALNKPGACSSISGSFPDENAFDGDFNTRWSSAWSDPEWIVVDLADFYNINAMTISWEAASSKSYMIMVSDDFVNWENVYSTTNSPGFADYIILDDTTEAKYVCMYGYERTTIWGHSLWEFQVRGDSSAEYQESTDQVTVEGLFKLSANPSTNDFRLFDNVRVLQDNTENYILTVDGFWLTSDEVTMNNVTASINDSIIVTGIKREKADSAGNTITELEIQELTVTWTSIEDLKNNDNLLKQNRPNPFSDKTIIEYSLEKKSQVEITILDVTGSKIQTLFSGMNKPGDYEIPFDGSKLPEGVYFYQLKADRETAVKKLTILR